MASLARWLGWRSLALLSLITACGKSSAPGNVDWKRFRNADQEPGQWLGLGRTYRAERYSPLDRINQTNVAQVGFAWEYDARSRRGRVEYGMEGTPLMVDGTLYASGPWGTVYAVDARTGKERWRYDPPADGSYGRRACCGVVNRGLQVWEGTVYVATLDGYLVALDAGTGKERWRADTFEDRDKRSYTITGPPIVAKNVVVIGNSGAEYGVRGYVTAYDLKTGQRAWRFYTVPRDPALGVDQPEMESAVKTWDPKSDWASGLGGTVWGEMTYDPELNLLYVGTGNSTPYPIWFRSPTGGDNLFLVSILAINPDDGRMAWYYQTTPGEMWDYTATSNMILADLTIGGQPRKVLMQAPKNGFFYVLDRATGKFISGKPFVYVNWASGIDTVTGRPIMTGKANYQKGPRVIFPTQAGAHNWQPMAYSPKTGLVYIPAREEGMVMSGHPEYKWRQGDTNLGSDAAMGVFTDLLPKDQQEEMKKLIAEQAEGHPLDTREALIAWDPVTQKERWRIPVGMGDWAGGGVLTTAGNLVVQGHSDGMLTFYRADTGEKLGEVETGTGIMAGPITYELDGEQYIAVLAGFGGAIAPSYPAEAVANRRENYGRILAFKLGGGKTPLPPLRQSKPTPEPPVLPYYTEKLAAQGEEIFLGTCAGCHLGYGEQRHSAYPDLHRLPPETHAVFDSIVLGGRLKQAGMASFADLLTPDQVKAIHAYLVREQRKLRAEEIAASGSTTR